MRLNSKSSGLIKREARRKRIILSQSQKDALCAWFEKNPYPDIVTREYLANRIGISESQILTWFQKHRTRKKQLESECSFGEYQIQGQNKSYFRTKAKEAGRTRTHFTRFQTSVLIRAFDKNRFPGIATRETLSRETGLPESRIQIWFQNRRSRHPGQSRGGLTDSLVEGSRWSPHKSVLLPQSNQFKAPNSTGPHSPSKASISNRSLESALSLPHTSLVSWDSSGGCKSHLSKTMMAQPSQATLGRDDSHTFATFTSHLSAAMTPGGEASSCLPAQGRCQGEHSDLEALPFKDSAQSSPDKQQLQGPGQKDTYFFLHCWDEWFQSVIAEWEPDKGHWSLP